MSSPFSPLPTDKTFEEYLAIPTKAYGVHHEWFPAHDIAYGPLSPTLNSFYAPDLSQTLFLHSPLTSSTSSFSAPSPGLSEPDHDSSGANSPSGSDAHSDPEQEQASWMVHDGYALRHISLHPQVMEDAPYTPPSAPCTSNAAYSTLTIPEHNHNLAPMTDDLSFGPRASRQKADANIAIIFDGESDVDAEGESDDGASEDEYVPSPRPQPRERHTYQHAYNSSRSQSPTSVSASSSSSSRPTRLRYPNFGSTASSPQDGLFRRTKPRHEQANAPISVDNVPSSSNRWKCPHSHCSYVQRNRRMPDFKRHLQTHTRFLEPEKWICCGIPISDASFGVIADSDPTDFGGRLMVGGCWKVFSRRDALKRHLDNKNISCAGNLNGPWMPGNHPN